MSGSGARGAAAGSVIRPGAARPRLDHEHRPVTGTVGEARLRPGRRCDACTDSRCESMHPKQPCKDQRPRQPSSPKAAASAGLARRGALRKDVSSDRGGPFGSLCGPGKTDGGTSRRGGGSVAAPRERRSPVAPGRSPFYARVAPWPREGPGGEARASRLRIATWLILPVVICLSQRLSHACLSISTYTVKLRMAH